MDGKQIESPKNGNTESINIFSNFKSIIKGSRKEKPIKFWFFSFLTILCIVAFICTLFKLYFIPSPFSKEITSAINYSIRLLSFSFLAVEIIYLFFLSCSIRKDLLRLALGIIIGGLILYAVISFYIGIKGILELQSIKSNDFFSYLAATAAFITAIVSIIGQNNAEKRAEKSESKLEEDSERGMFFQLLDLYNRQQNSIIYEGSMQGIQSLEEISETADRYFTLNLVYEHIKNSNESDFNANYNGRKLDLICFEDEECKKGYELLKTKLVVSDFSTLKYILVKEDIPLIENPSETVEKKKQRINQNLMKKEITILNLYKNVGEDISKLFTWGVRISQIHFKTKGIQYVQENAKFVGNLLYRHNSHILGQYYRNVYYLLETTSEFKKANSYIKLFRAQLSTSELNLLLYNLFSSQSNARVLTLLDTYDIFNNIQDSNLLLVSMHFDEEKSKSEKIQILFTRNSPT